MTSEPILGVPIEIWSFESAIDWLIAEARGHAGPARRVHFATVHSVVGARRDERLRGVFTSATKVSPDGVPLVWVVRWRGRQAAQRVCGPDVMLALCDAGRGAGLRHYFLGGRPGVADALARRLTARFPGLEVVGTYSPSFRASKEDDDRAREQIRCAAPDVLWVGLGSPKQEFWAAEHTDLPVGLVLPVGAAFDFHAGTLRRAPRWMQRAGLEWVFRLAMEPRRLAGRYLVTNSRFVVGIALEEARRLARRRRA